MKLNIKRTIDKDTTPDEIIAHLLKDRGIIDTQAFFNPFHPKDIDFKDFFEDGKKYQKDIHTVIKLLKNIKKSGKSIVVYTDYDADGLTGGAILWETLHLLGFNVMPYVPNRKTEGYGFSEKGLDTVKKQFDPALIISVDHGIVAHRQIAYAKSLGIPIIVTDHHQKLDKKHDDAFAVFHTDQLSGSSVAYFFAKELYENFNPPAESDSAPAGGSNAELLEHNFSNDYLALASIGTIADMVPLVGRARSVVKHGLTAFNSLKRPGIVELLQQAGIADRAITPFEVGFMIAPRINAFGRIGIALDALRLLCTKHRPRAFELAQKAGETNKERQRLLETAMKEAEAMVNTAEKLLIVYSDKWEEGIIGLIASRLGEKYYRPTIALTRSDGFFKASARSIPRFDITAFLRSLKKYLVDVGGHSGAAGFTIKAEKLEEFIKAAQKKADTLLKTEDLLKQLYIDFQIPFVSATIALAAKLEELQPFGMGNLKPVFYSTGTLVNASLVGKTKTHVKLTVKDGTSVPLEMMFFNGSALFKTLTPGQFVSTAYTIEVNRWNGREKATGIGKYIQ